MKRSHDHLSTLVLARRVANYAADLGASNGVSAGRFVADHIGAVLADCVLQAGLNYRTVVRVRIERIIREFPEAATLVGVSRLVRAGRAPDFLMWKHSEKIRRFEALVEVLEGHRIGDSERLRMWLQRRTARNRLLEVVGIGPKTIDYLSCLVGNDCIAVDRHIRAFLKQVGITSCDYEGLKLVASYAADLLNMSRRDFDSWIWRYVSSSAGIAAAGGNSITSIAHSADIEYVPRNAFDA